jgi:hypothetical protein
MAKKVTSKPELRQDAADETIEETKLAVAPGAQEQKALVSTSNEISDDEIYGEALKDKAFERDQLVIPFLKILQQLSPYVDENNSDHIPGAKSGMFFNTGTMKLYPGDKGLVIVPITHQKSYTEWKPKRGGFVKDWKESLAWQNNCAPDQRDAYLPVTKEGNNIIKAQFHYVFIVNEETGAFEPCIFNFYTTFLKRARRWSAMIANAMIATPNGPRQAAHSFYSYKVVTAVERNEQGSWYFPKITANVINDKWISVRELINGKAVWDAAKAFRESLLQGTVTAENMSSDDVVGVSNREVDDGDEKPF